MSLCSICQLELKITKTNTELSAHATGKHGSTLEECFPGAGAVAAELAAATAKKGGGDVKQGETKAQKKKKADAGFDDMLNAGLKSGKKK